ncbi:MAG: PAS fold protein [Methanocella sp. PtaU1.Bin125]|nr:MAG: PAS fold protein [Methanocella sp. PtaU1.Bin125]
MTHNHSDTDLGHTGPSIPSPPQEGRGLLWHNLTDFYCNFFDLIEAVAIMIDKDGIIRMFNRKAERLTGYSRTEAIGQDCFSLLLPGHLCAAAREMYLRGLKEDRVPPAIATDITTRTGAVLPVDWSVSIVRDDDGAVFGLVGLGYLRPAGTPAVGLTETKESVYSFVESMTHDLLNHSQVAMGYLELAIERADDDTDLKCMLNRAYDALKKCGNIAISVHKLGAGPDPNGYARLAGYRKDGHE